MLSLRENLHVTYVTTKMLHSKIISRYVAGSLHGCQETRFWQDSQERLTITWQDIPSIKNSIEPKTMN